MASVQCARSLSNNVMALLYIVLLIPVAILFFFLYIFFREIVKQHFQRIVINQEGIFSRLIFAVDAICMAGSVFTAVVWVLHVANK